MASEELALACYILAFAIGLGTIAGILRKCLPCRQRQPPDPSPTPESLKERMAVLDAQVDGS